MSQPWFNAYTGIPFADHGRDRSACDCYGLIRLVYFEQRGIVLPLLDNYETTRDREELEKIVRREPLLIGFEQVDLDLVQPFDVLVIRQVGFDCHLGLVVNRNTLLHTESGKGSVLEDFTRPHVRPRIREAWRYVE